MLSVIITIHVIFLFFFEKLEVNSDSLVIRTLAIQSPKMHKRNPVLGNRKERTFSLVNVPPPLNSQEVLWGLSVGKDKAELFLAIKKHTVNWSLSSTAITHEM